MEAQSVYPHRESVEWFSLDVGNRSTIFFISVGMFFWFCCTHGANQVALQRYFTVESVRAARKSYLVSALSSFALSIILAGVGLSLLYFIQNHELPAAPGVEAADQAIRYDAQDKIFPQFIRFYLPSGLRGLVVAALFAAAMSTIDSGANSISTIVTVDFFRHRRSGPPSAQAELRLARKLTASMGLIIVTLTILLYHVSKGTDIITLCQKGFNCFLGPLGALFVLGMWSKRATAVSVIPAVIAGELFGVCASYSKELFDFAYSTHLVVPGSWLVTLVAAYLLSLVLRTRASDDAQQWMWRSVVSRELENTSANAAANQE